MYSLACQSVVCTGEDNRNTSICTGHLWIDTNMQHICECVESVVRQQKSICPCVFPSPWSSSPGLTLAHIPMTVSHQTEIDRLWHPLSPPHTFGGRDLFCLTGYGAVYITLYAWFPLCCEPKRQKRNRFFPPLSLFPLKFLREKRHMSYCCSGCGGLNMYNTSRHDHFL